MALPNVSSSNLSVLDDASFPLFGWLAQTINDSRAISINGDLLWNAYKSDSDKSFIEKIREKSLRAAITANPRDMLSEMKDSVIVIYRESDAWSVTINGDLSVVISKSLIAKADDKAPEIVRAVSVVADVVAEVAKADDKAPEIVRAVSVVADVVADVVAEVAKADDKAPEIVRAVSVVAEVAKAPEIVRAVSVVAEVAKVDVAKAEVVAEVAKAEVAKAEVAKAEVVQVVRSSDK